MWYKTLQVSQDASIDEIRLSYRKLILKHHPDKGGSAEEFNTIQDAYCYALVNKTDTIKQQMDYIDSRLSKEYKELTDLVLTYIVDCRMAKLVVKRNILVNCLKIKGIPSYGRRVKDIIRILFIGISNERILNALKELNINTPPSLTRAEIIEKLLYSTDTFYPKLINDTNTL